MHERLNLQWFGLSERNILRPFDWGVTGENQTTRVARAKY
jgi:hypothetical protein